MNRIAFINGMKTEETYWNKLNPMNKDKKTLSANSMIMKVKKACSIKEDRSHYLFRLLSRNENKILKMIMLSSPEKLEKISVYIEKFLDLYGISPIYKYESGKIELTEVGKYIYSVFNYEGQGKYIVEAKKIILENCDILICPYCNAASVKAIELENKIIKEYDLDHYLPKSKYPYFAMSLYNLIPSCKVCNQTYKKAKDFKTSTHLNPHIDNFSTDCHFKLLLNNDVKLKDKILELAEMFYVNEHEARKKFNDEISCTLKLVVEQLNPELEMSKIDNFVKDMNIIERYDQEKFRIIPLFYIFMKKFSKSQYDYYSEVLSNWNVNKKIAIEEYCGLELVLNNGSITSRPYTKFTWDMQNFIFSMKTDRFKEYPNFVELIE